MTMSLLTVLFLIFLVLKLTGNIDWSWLVIFLPLIINFILSVSVEFYKD